MLVFATTVFGMQDWLFWIILMIVFSVFEASTVALLSVWFAVGALMAAIAAALGASFTIQVIVFVLASIAFFAIGWRFRDRIWIARKHKTPTNTDRLIGKEALVLIPIENISGRGQVKVEGNIWSARSADESVINEGEYVRIKSIVGSKLLVERLET